MGGEWAPIRLGDVCSKIGSGATPRGGNEVYLESGPFALIRSQNVYNDGFHRDGLAYIGDHHAAELANVEVLAGDVLLNITGDSVARACQVDSGVLPARVNQHVAVVRPDRNRLDPRFLRYLLISPNMQSKLLSWAGSGGTRNALTKSMIEAFEILAPEDIGEQRAIAHILGTLDDKIELNRQMAETLEAMARALFKSWFVDFDPVCAKAEGRDPGLPKPLADRFPSRLVDSELGQIPAEWKAGTLADFASLNPEAWSKETRPNVINYMDLSSTKWGRIEAIRAYAQQDAPSRAQRVLRPKDTVIGTVRPGNGSYTFITEAGLTGSTGFAVLRPRRVEFAEFIYLAATAAENIEALSHLADGGAYPAIRPEVVAATPVIEPDAKVLAAFSKSVASLLAKMARSERESRTLAALRDTLLPKLISGELRAKDAETINGGAV
ncbi:MAG TPA: restriction endonuclease subunit S [Candidatus Eisenbacteria bacterium]|jgi:type I restriction enzyme S subunit